MHGNRAVSAVGLARGVHLARRGFAGRIPRLASRVAQPRRRGSLSARSPDCRRVVALGDWAGEAPAGGLRDEPCARGPGRHTRGVQPVRPETRQGCRCRHRDVARDAATAAAHRRRRRALATRAARGRAAHGGHPHAGRLDPARTEAPTVVGRHRRARAGQRPPRRGVLCPTSCADRTRSRADHSEPGAGTDPLGTTSRSRRRRWLTGNLPSAARQLRARRQQRLPGRERLAVAARVGGDPRGLPSRKPNG
jgi:hypothetical protein